MSAYEKYIADNVRGKVVADLGSGPGILAWLALLYGAKKVYIVDYNPDSLKVAHSIMKSWGDRVVPIYSDLITEYTPAPDIDIFIHEILGHIVFDEMILNIVDNLHRHNAAHKHMDMRFEFFDYRCTWAEVESVYDKSLFSSPVAEYHNLIENRFPGLIKFCTQTIASHTKKDYVEYPPFFTYNINTQPVEEGFNQYLIDRLLFDKNIGWRTYIGNYSFTNIPRILNNWYSITTVPRARLKTRIPSTYKPVANKKNVNPYRENLCPFFK